MCGIALLYGCASRVGFIPRSVASSITSNTSFELPDGHIIRHAPLAVNPIRPLPSADAYRKWIIVQTNCLIADGTKCEREERVYANKQGHSPRSKRGTSVLSYTEYCFEDESSYVDENGTIWGASVECSYYLYDDGSDIDDGSAGGGGGGGGGGSEVVTTCKVPGASALINSLISASPRDQALLASISSNNGPSTQPTFTETTLPVGTIAKTDYAAHTINFDSAQIDAAIAAGQDIGAIIEHELLHLWLETGDRETGIQPHPFPAAGVDQGIVVTLDDGTTLTFRQKGTRNPSTGYVDLSPGYAGYEHVIIHQILINENPAEGDRTGAMMSAFLEASTVTLPGGTPQTITDEAVARALGDAHKKSKANVMPPALPSGGRYMKCTTMAVNDVMRSTKASRHTSETVVFSGETYEVPWDGARY
jgi:hypothetical protein